MKYFREAYKNYSAYETADDVYDIYLYANENPINLFITLTDDEKDDILFLDYNRYPDSDCRSLKEAYADYAGVLPENITVGNGSDELIRVIGDVFLENGEYVISHEPTFSMYARCAEVARGNYYGVMPRDDSLRANADDIIAKANELKAKLIFICNPNNPTGELWDEEDIIKIIKNTDSVVVIDEAYGEFAGINSAYLANEYNNVIILKTLSKAFAMAGMRVGFAIASKEISDVLNMAVDTYNVNTFSQAAAKLMLTRKDKMRIIAKDLAAEAKRLGEELAKFDGITVYPTVTNFVLIKTDKNKEIYEALKKSGILVRGYSKGLLSDYLRISAGTRSENDSFLKVVSEVMS
ncbi:MAG: histidinol-phosphate transaminase [Eubacteriaceae bacterium]|nr:histidinol-phosphate transaminase [Eubacteriaceae bacterium]